MLLRPAVVAGLLLVACPAGADLYRWVDPQSGSVKLSSTPPPWMESGRGPAVKVVPYKRPPAVAAVQEPIGLETRWREIMKTFAGAKDIAALASLRAQVRDYEEVKSELDRRDPAGASRRLAEENALIDAMRARTQAARP